MLSNPYALVAADRALPGRDAYAFTVPPWHAVLPAPLAGPWPDGTAVLYVAMGCFWGAEKAMWRLPGVVTTAVGYQGGFTPHPTYEEVCTGLTGHAETVLVAYDPGTLDHVELARTFWTLHDPTQGFRQGNDVGTQYRSAVFWTTPEQERAAVTTQEAYGGELVRAGFGPITTQILRADDAGPFYYAEGYHQQYLFRNETGYCPDHSTGVSCPVGRDLGPGVGKED